MDSTAHAPWGAERRAHPRHERRQPLAVQPLGRKMILAETVDVSAGGMRVRASSRMPLGACDIVLAADPADRLVVRGTVVDEVLDVSTGEVTARIVFASEVSVLAQQVAVRTDREILVTRRRGMAVIAVVVALVVGGAALVLSDDAEPAPNPVSTAGALPDRDPSTTSVPRDVALTVPTTVVTSAPPRTAAPTPSSTAAPSPTTTGVSPSPTVAPAQTRSEPADNAMSVILGTSPEDTAVSSSMGPSQGVDTVRVQLHVTPEPDGTTLPVAVTVENRGSETLQLPDGLRAVITATRDGAVAGTTLSAAEITEVAPGQLVSVEGSLDFGSTGEYDVVAQVDVAG